MGWISRKAFNEMHSAIEAQRQAREREVEARRDGRSKAEIRRLERGTVEAARRMNEAARKR